MERRHGVRWGTGALVCLAGRAALVLAIGAAAASMGCQQQQLEERNAALQKQLEQALTQNGDLQAENEGIKTQNQGLVAELDKARAAARPGTLPPAAPARPPGAKPDFGEGIDVSEAGGVTTITLPDTILFASGSATLKADSKRVLDKIGGVLARDYAKARIRVEGHTDNQPIAKTKNLWIDNWDLSCNRAMAVVRHLVSKGIDPKQIYAAGCSFYRPVASNDSAAGRTRNRRVAIVVTP